MAEGPGPRQTAQSALTAINFGVGPYIVVAIHAEYHVPYQGRPGSYSATTPQVEVTANIDLPDGIIIPTWTITQIVADFGAENIFAFTGETPEPLSEPREKPDPPFDPIEVVEEISKDMKSFSRVWRGKFDEFDTVTGGSDDALIATSNVLVFNVSKIKAANPDLEELEITAVTTPGTRSDGNTAGGDDTFVIVATYQAISFVETKEENEGIDVTVPTKGNQGTDKLDFTAIPVDFWNGTIADPFTGQYEAPSRYKTLSAAANLSAPIKFTIKLDKTLEITYG